MNFKVGDKVRITNERISSCSIYEPYRNEILEIIKIYKDNFCMAQDAKGCALGLYLTSLEKVNEKNKQMLFDFMYE